MNKLLVALCALFATSAVMADLAPQATTVKCTRVSQDRQGNPSETELNAWLAKAEREDGKTNTSSVSVTFIGNAKYLVCRTVQP